MNMNPKVAILYTEGINRDQESLMAFEMAGALPERVHLNQLKSGEKKLRDYQILFFPGGFSYGDHLFSAKIWAGKFLAYFKDDLQAFSDGKGLILGICNGFQFLVRTGLLPFVNLGKIESTLTFNASNHFESRWIRVRVEPSACEWMRSLEGKILRMPTSHGEGRFLAPDEAMKQIEANGQIALRYIDAEDQPTQHYPENPNGSSKAIAGLVSPNGRVFGAMPHPECNTRFNHHPNWNDPAQRGGECLELFKNAVGYFQKF